LARAVQQRRRKRNTESSVIAFGVEGDPRHGASIRRDRTWRRIRQEIEGTRREVCGTVETRIERLRDLANGAKPPSSGLGAREAAAQRARGVFDPLLIGTNGGGELSYGEHHGDHASQRGINYLMLPEGTGTNFARRRRLPIRADGPQA
jgi:hypothetical protein